MKKLTLLLSLFLFLVMSPNAQGDIIGQLTIPGTGDSQTLLRSLAHEFQEKNPGATINIPSSIGSSGGIKMLLAGKSNIARIARPLKKEERDKGLTTRTFALSPIVFVVNPKITNLTNITSQQIVGIYEGTIHQWSNLGVHLDTIYPLTREQGDSSLLVLNRYIDNFATINTLKAKVIYTTPDTVKILKRYKRTIGFIPAADALHNNLQILTIDGVAPTAKNATSGLYKYITPLGFAYKEKESHSVLGHAFIKFVFSPEGKRIMYENGVFPALQ